MKTWVRNLFLMLVLITGVGLLLAGRVTAQTFTVLHSFTATSGTLHTNSDGAVPLAGLVLSGGVLYGTVEAGGSGYYGRVFAVNSYDSGFTTLHDFTGGSDGAIPVAGLILSGATLYGTAYYGGSSGSGTVFKVNTNGTGFTTLHSFTATSTN